MNHVTSDDCHPRDTDHLAEGGPDGVPVLVRDDDGQAGLAPVAHTQLPQEGGQERAVAGQGEPAGPHHRILVPGGEYTDISVQSVHALCKLLSI